MKRYLALLIGSSLMAVGAVTLPAANALAAGDCTKSAFSGVTACEGSLNGNNSNQSLDGLFDINWKSGSFVSGEIKVDNGSGGSSSGFSFTSDAGKNKQSGTWSLDSSLTDQYESGMFVVKAGSSFSAYFWDGLSSTGTWDTKGVKLVGKGNTPDLSHFSFYGFGQRVAEPPIPRIPEPAAMAGLMAVGVGIVTSRRQQAQQA